MKRKLLLVGAGANQIRMILKAKEMGLHAIAVDGNPSAPGFAFADDAEALDIMDGAALTTLARRHAVDGIFPAAEWGVEATAVATTALGLVGVPPEVAVLVRDKHAMRQMLANKGVPTPPFKGVRSAPEAIEAANAIGFPVIMKPADSAASRGVLRVNRPEEVDAAFHHAFQWTRNGIVLVEAYVRGEEYSVDGLVYKGRYILGGITEKQRSVPPNCFDLALSMPPRIPDTHVDTIVEAVDQALSALGFTNGATHIELILSPDGPRMVEMAGRPGGARIPTDLVPLGYGIDYIADCFRIALGEAPCEQPGKRRGSCIYWLSAEPGRVERIEGVEEARAVPGMVDLVVAAKVGDHIEPLIDCVTRDKVGYALASGATPDEAFEAAKTASRLCRVITS